RLVDLAGAVRPEHPQPTALAEDDLLVLLHELAREVGVERRVVLEAPVERLGDDPRLLLVPGLVVPVLAGLLVELSLRLLEVLLLLDGGELRPARAVRCQLGQLQYARHSRLLSQTSRTASA